MAEPFFYQPVDPFTGSTVDKAPPDFLRTLPRMPSVAQPSGVIGPGLRAGFNEAQGLLGAAVSAGGALVGSDTVRDWGAATRDANFAEAQQVGRPDLETAPWNEGGAPVLPWLGYQAAKQAPQLAAAIGAALLVPQAAVPAGLARAAAAAPGWLGGGGLKAGASFAARRAAMETGKTAARGLVGAEVAGIPFAAGSMYSEAMDRGDPTAADAAKAFALSPLYSALEAVQPAQLQSFVTKGLKGNIAKRVGTAALAGAVTEMPTEAAQTAIELSFRPDIPLADKANQIVDAALTGGAIGGLFGGAAGVRKARDLQPANVSNDDIRGIVDSVLTTVQPDGQGAFAGPGFDTPPAAAYDATTQQPRPLAPLETEALQTGLEDLQRSGDQSGDAMRLRDLTRRELTRRESEPTPFAGESDAALQRGMAVIEARVQGGLPLSPDQERIYRTMWTEMERRAAAPKTDDGQLGLFKGLPEQRAPDAAVAVLNDQKVTETRARARALAGIKPDAKNSLIDSLNVADDAGLVDTVLDRLEAGSSDQTTMKLAEGLGIIDSKGQPQDLNAAVANAAKTVESLWARARAVGGSALTEAQNAQRDMRALMAKRDLVAQVQQARADRAAAADRELYRRADAALYAATPVGTQFGFENTPPVRPPSRPPVVPGPAAPEVGGLDGAQGDLLSWREPPPLPAPSVMPAAAPDLAAQARQTMTTSPQIGPIAGPLAQVLTSRGREADFDAAALQAQERQFQQAEGALIAQEQAGIAPEPVAVRGIARTQDRKGGVTYNVSLSNGATVPLKMRAVGADRGVYLGDERVGATLQEAAQAVARRAGEQAPAAPEGGYQTRYREGQPTAGLPIQQVQDVVARVTAEWPNAPVSVVASSDDLPTAVRAAVEKDGMSRAMGLVGRDGRVYLLAENIANEDQAVATIYHELLGHMGLSKRFGERLDSVLRQMLKNPQLRKDAEAWRQLNPGAYDGDLLRAAEEVLARRSEYGPVIQSLWQKIVAVVREFGRRVGFVKEFTDNDINAILAASHALAMKQVKQTVRAGGNRYMYVGQNMDPISGLDKMMDLAIAMDAENRNVDPVQIRLMTGWFRNPFDKQWRSEVTDEYARFKIPFDQIEEKPLFGAGREYTLGEVLDHPELFELYPQLKDIKFAKQAVFGDYFKTIQGSFNRAENFLKITPYAIDPMSVVLHELQHAVQRIEGFARGSNVDRVVDDLNEEQFLRLRAEGEGVILKALARASRKLETFQAVLAHPRYAEYAALYEDEKQAWQEEGDRKFALFSQIVRLRSEMVEDLKAQGYDDSYAVDSLRSSVAERSFKIGAAQREYDAAQAKMEKVAGLTSRQDIAKALISPERLFQAYEAAAGEIEANDTAGRMGVPQEMRRTKTPYMDTIDRKRIDTSLITVSTGGDGGKLQLSMMRPGPTPEQQNAAVQQIAAAADARLEDVSQSVAQTVAAADKPAPRGKLPLIPGKPALGEMKISARRTALYMSSLGHIVEFFGKLFPNGSLQRYARAHQIRVAAEARLSQLALKPYYEYENLRGDKAAIAAVNKLMGATEFGIDPAKTWDEQPHLHEAPMADVLRKHTAMYNQLYRQLRQRKDKRALTVYEDFRNVNEGMHFAQQTMALYNLVISNPDVAAQIPSAAQNPMVVFMSRASLHESPKEARDYWKAASAELMKDVTLFTDQQYGLARSATKGARQKIEKLASPLAATVTNIQRQQEVMALAPYFHLGRFGNYFVAFNIPPLEGTRRADQAKVQAVARELEKAGFRGVQLSEGTDRSNVFIRLETMEQAENLRTLLTQLEKRGMVVGGSIQAGPRTRDASWGNVQQIMQRVIEAVGSSDAFIPDDSMTDEQKAQLETNHRQLMSTLREVGLNMLPDTSIAKVMVHRDSVPGFTTDMVRSYAFRSQVGAHALANLTASSMLVDAFTGMKQAVSEAKTRSDRSIYPMNDVVTELMTREAVRPSNTGATWVDKVRAFNHAYFLGLSPAYALINMTQIPVLLWPELAKRHGFTKSAKAIARVTPIAMKVISATLKQGVGLGFRRAADATITDSVLDAAGVKKADAEFIMKIVNRGILDIGSASREHGRIVEDKLDSKTDLALRYASALGFYTEMASRLVAALSARELHKGDAASMEEYAVGVVDQSMLNYSAYNIARATGKSGVFGAATPLPLSFMQYSFQLMEKLYREVHNSFAKDLSPGQRREARRYLMGHLTAITVFAGTLGMPMASIAARVIEKAVEWTDDEEEPYDAKAAWRNFLADIFGPDIGEVLARGAPRAFGIDISQRAGEADILPGTRLLVDKRDWNEAAADWARNALGSPVSMGLNILSGGSKIAEGNVLAGMREMLPLAFGNLTEAYRMTAQGYVDTRGNPLPLTPGATDILVQALGFAPARRAEYQEARGMQQSRKGEVLRNATNIRKNLAAAIESGDEASAREWLQRARSFDDSNPGYAILPGLPGVLKQRAKARAMAEMTGLPVGTNLRDPGAQELTRFANY